MTNTFTYGYASSGIVPLRREQSDASEMCTQLLLGETFKILETSERWYRIETDFDRYTGWVNRSETSPLTTDDYESWTEDARRVTSWYYSYYGYEKAHNAILIPPGSRVIPEAKNGTVRLPHGVYKPNRSLNSLSKTSIIDTAMGFLGAPYLWGGRTDVGIDCSGLIQTVYLLHDRFIPCDSWKQEEYLSEPIEHLQQAQRGDIVFFNPSGEKVSHVAFYLGDGAVLHASGKVKINTIADWADGDYAEEWYNERLAKSIHSIYRS